MDGTFKDMTRNIVIDVDYYILPQFFSPHNGCQVTEGQGPSSEDRMLCNELEFS